MRKGNFKEIANKLDSIGYAFTKDDKVIYLIDGPKKDSQYVVSTITDKMQSEPIAFVDTTSLMWSHESWLVTKNNQDSLLPSVNFSQQTPVHRSI